MLQHARAPVLRRTPSKAAATRTLVASATMQRASASMEALMPGFLQRVAEVNTAAASREHLVPFRVDGTVVGHLRQDFANKVAGFKGVFQQHELQSEGQAANCIMLDDSLATQQQRTAAVAGVLEQLRDAGHVTGWRGELYPVASSFGCEPVLLMERAAAPYFGIKAYGVHVNGYVRDAQTGDIKLWVARRSANKQTWPGKLDHIVAGGQPAGISCQANVIKECGEEASIPAELAARAHPVGFVSYTSMSEQGLKPDVLFCYDLELPADFVPVPDDGEVEEFMLWDLDKVAHTVATTTDYKPNVCLVIIDMLVRHGYITPDMPHYTELVSALRPPV